MIADVPILRILIICKMHYLSYPTIICFFFVSYIAGAYPSPMLSNFKGINHYNFPNSRIIFGDGALDFEEKIFQYGDHNYKLLHSSIPLKYTALEAITAQYLPQPANETDFVSMPFYKGALAGYFFKTYGDSLGLKDYEKQHSVDIMSELGSENDLCGVLSKSDYHRATKRLKSGKERGVWIQQLACQDSVGSVIPRISEHE